MYPASRLVWPDPRSPIVPKLLSLVAAVVLLFAVLEVFYVLKPGPPHYAQGNVVMPYCPYSMGGGKQAPPGAIRHVCHLFVPDQHVALRAGIGVVALGIVGGLMLAASRRNSPLGLPMPA